MQYESVFSTPASTEYCQNWHEYYRNNREEIMNIEFYENDINYDANRSHQNILRIQNFP